MRYIQAPARRNFRNVYFLSVSPLVSAVIDWIEISREKVFFNEWPQTYDKLTLKPKEDEDLFAYSVYQLNGLKSDNEAYSFGLDDLCLVDVYPLEVNSGGEKFVWTKPKSIIQVPYDFNLEKKPLININLETLPIRGEIIGNMKIDFNGCEPKSLDILPEAVKASFSYQCLSNKGEANIINLEVDPFNPSSSLGTGDDRDLGIALTGISIN